MVTPLGASKRIPSCDLSLFAVLLNSVRACTYYILILYFKTNVTGASLVAIENLD